MSFEEPRASLSEAEIDLAINNAVIGRHWHAEPIKRRGRTAYYVEVHEVDEIVVATKGAIRDQIRMALLGCDHTIGYCPDDAS